MEYTEKTRYPSEARWGKSQSTRGGVGLFCNHRIEGGWEIYG